MAVADHSGVDMAFGVNRELFDVEGGPVEAAEGWREVAGDLGGEEAVFKLEGDAVELEVEEA